MSDNFRFWLNIKEHSIELNFLPPPPLQAYRLLWWPCYGCGDGGWPPFCPRAPRASQQGARLPCQLLVPTWRARVSTLSPWSASRPMLLMWTTGRAQMEPVPSVLTLSWRARLRGCPQLWWTGVPCISVTWSCPALSSTPASRLWAAARQM